MKINWSLSLALASFLVWWFAIGGTALYAVPVLMLFFLWGQGILKGQYWDLLLGVQSQLLKVIQKIPLSWHYYFVAFNGLIWLLYALVKYWSFGWIWADTGFFSNVTYNMSLGDYTSSYYEQPSLADHFALLLVPLSWLYRLAPSALWILLAKMLSYMVGGFGLISLAREVAGSELRAKVISGSALGLYLFFYGPLISSVQYEFQPSSLSLAFIVYGYLRMVQRRWVSFVLLMACLVFTKENAPSVLIGLGLHMLLMKRYKLGVALTIIGTLLIYLILFQVMPYLRDYQPSWSGLERLDPFKLIPEKLLYLWLLTYPLAFIPVVYWRYGIMAAPAIGINLLSGWWAMVSTRYHYDDIPGTLLILATLVNLEPFFALVRQRVRPTRAVVWGTLLFALYWAANIPGYSNIRRVLKRIPTQSDWALSAEVQQVDQLTANQRIGVTQALSPHFNRRQIEIIDEPKPGNCLDQRHHLLAQNPLVPPYQYVVVAKDPKYFQFNDLESCLEQYRQSCRFVEVPGLTHLVLFKREERAGCAE